MMLHDVGGVHIPRLVSTLCNSVAWRAGTSDLAKMVYLTYDDGPSIPFTEELLGTLASHDARASFFMLGTQMRHHPHLVYEVARAGHSIGVHGFRHLDAWLRRPSTVLADLDQAVAGWRALHLSGPLLYRPPYGHLTPGLMRALRCYRGTIVMWDLLPGDYDVSESPAAVARRIVRFIRPGSIIALHDGARSGKRAVDITRRTLEVLSPMGWQFAALSKQAFAI